MSIDWSKYFKTEDNDVDKPTQEIDPKCEWREIQQQLLTPSIVFSIFRWPFEAKFMLMKSGNCYFQAVEVDHQGGQKRKSEPACTKAVVPIVTSHDVNGAASRLEFFFNVLTLWGFSSLSLFHCLKCPIPICRRPSSDRSSGRECSDSETDEYCGVVCRQVSAALYRFESCAPDDSDKKNSVKMRTRMVPLQALRKRDSKVGSLRVLGKEELKCALCVGQSWLYGHKTNIPGYTPWKWGWEMS